jgi:hypothetical protein
MLAHDAFDWTNAVVGGAGLFLTVATLMVAQSAKKAAIGARTAIWRREASTVIAEIASLSYDLASQIEAERFQAAQTRARDISSRLARDQERFRRYVSREFSQLVDLEKKFSEIAEKLSNSDTLRSRNIVLQLSNSVHESNRILNGIYGRLESGLDQEA